jgi:hypothetical protein
MATYDQSVDEDPIYFSEDVEQHEYHVGTTDSVSFDDVVGAVYSYRASIDDSISFDDSGRPISHFGRADDSFHFSEFANSHTKARSASSSIAFFEAVYVINPVIYAPPITSIIAFTDVATKTLTSNPRTKTVNSSIAFTESKTVTKINRQPHESIVFHELICVQGNVARIKLESILFTESVHRHINRSGATGNNPPSGITPGTGFKMKSRYTRLVSDKIHFEERVLRRDADGNIISIDPCHPTISTTVILIHWSTFTSIEWAELTDWATMVGDTTILRPNPLGTYINSTNTELGATMSVILIDGPFLNEFGNAAFYIEMHQSGALIFTDVGGTWDTATGEIIVNNEGPGTWTGTYYPPTDLSYPDTIQWGSGWHFSDHDPTGGEV